MKIFCAQGGLKMGAFSRSKGKRGEQELVRLIKDNGYKARRTAQFCGKTGEAADVIGLPGISIECKRVEKLNIYDAITQAQRDAEAAGRGDLPAVFHRKNNCPWLVTVRVEDFFKLYREWEAGQDAGQDKTDG